MTRALALSVPFPSMTGSLDTYIQSVNRFPLLTQEEETALARRLRDHPAVQMVRYPGLDDPVAARYVSSFGPLLSFEVTPGRADAADKVVAEAPLEGAAEEVAGSSS